LYHLDAMLAALQLGLKTVNGYSSSCNRYFGPFWNYPNATALTYWCTQMNLDKNTLLLVK